jgi:hypothetical protein
LYFNWYGTPEPQVPVGLAAPERHEAEQGK